MFGRFLWKFLNPILSGNVLENILGTSFVISYRIWVEISLENALEFASAIFLANPFDSPHNFPKQFPKNAKTNLKSFSKKKSSKLSQKIAKGNPWVAWSSLKIVSNRIFCRKKSKNKVQKTAWDIFKDSTDIKAEEIIKILEETQTALPMEFSNKLAKENPKETFEHIRQRNFHNNCQTNFVRCLRIIFPKNCQVSYE